MASSPSGTKTMKPLRDDLERLYSALNKRCYVNPDPLMFLYDYGDPADVELVAFIASSLAYGRVMQILASVKKVLSPMGKSPSRFVLETPDDEFGKIYSSFKHRFNTGDDVALFLRGLKKLKLDYGTLENAFLDGFKEDDANVINAASCFAKKVCRFFPGKKNFLMPDPEDGSACKRLFLSLRWLVRKDDVDLGIWKKVPASKLVVPLDTHMFRISKFLGLSSRSAADVKSAHEITEAYKSYSPDDPVKYDFSLTRFGIHPEISKRVFPIDVSAV